MCLESIIAINDCSVPEESTQHCELKQKKPCSSSEPALLKEHTGLSQLKPKSAPFKKADSLKLRFIPSLPPRTADSTAVRSVEIKISQKNGAENSLEIRSFEVCCKAFSSPPSEGCKALRHPGFRPVL